MIKSNITFKILRYTKSLNQEVTIHREVRGADINTEARWLRPFVTKGDHMAPAGGFDNTH